MVLGTRRRVLLTAVAVLLAAVVAVAAVRAAADDELSLPRHRLGPGGSELRGSPDAPVLVEAYGDFACPGCARFHRQASPCSTSWSARVASGSPSAALAWFASDLSIKLLGHLLPEEAPR